MNYKKRLPRDVIDKLCTSLNVGVGELLTHEKSTES
ncbi:helix-turn-helix domain-containing protein [Desulfitobacterium hafniense]